MSSPVSTHQLEVSGGTVYYEVRGSGPLLLVIGQPMTSGPFGPLADALADDHTVVTYDPHGLGASSIADPSADVTPEIEAEDLARIVDAVGAPRADVFASSGGAVAGLAFAAGYPEKVGTLIAHEPPVTELLPDAPHVRKVVDEIEDAYRTQGPGAAFGMFIGLVMHSGPLTAEGVTSMAAPPSDERSEKQQADDELFLLRMLKPFTRYEPPIDTLRSGTLAWSSPSARHPWRSRRRSAEVLAERLGTTPTMFPGDHGGFMADPPATAARIRDVL